MEKITDRTPSEALNDNLKGLYMGMDIFKRYEKKCKSNDLKNLLNDVINLYSKETCELSSKISALGDSSPASNVGILGKASEAIYNIKTVTADTDSEILEESIKAFKTGIIMFQKFLHEKEDQLDKESIDLVKNMIQENEELSKKLNEYSSPHQANFF
ncbi:PA2169 family four-helix-bundle protein [Clostridium perfringens]|nr:PA2169 family four-helix-bundle protein [Clostridium perfringens]